MVCASAPAASYWSGGNSGLWGDVQTWGGGGYPVAGDYVYVNVGSTITIVGTAEAALELHQASWSGNSDPVTLDISNAGSLITSGVAHIGVAGGDVGIVELDGTSIFTTNGALNVGYNGNGTLNTYGTVNANSGLYVSNPWAAGSGTLNIYDGTVNASEFAMSGTGLVNIEAGELRIYGLWYDATLTALIGADQIVAYSGAETVVLSHDGDYTVLTATPEPATMLILALGGLLIRRKK